MTGMPGTGLRRAALAAILAAALLVAVGIAASKGLLLGNATTSVARGLYMRASPGGATHVTFCLGGRHAAADWYRRFCSPDDPDGVRILKRLDGRRGGHVTVAGDGPRALDSRVLGPVRLDEIRGWWVPLARIGGAGR